MPTSRKFKYQEGISYVYKYAVNVNTNLGGEESVDHPQKESTLCLEADLIIRFSSPCEGSLKFYNASLSHDRAKYNPDFPDRAGADFKTNLERFVLKFAYDDGKIEELCPQKQEPIWTLNLKRGVLSMLQNTMLRLDVDRRVDELDVNGICQTTYRLHESKRTSLILKKSKNLSNCMYGSKHFSIIQSNTYRSPRSSSHPLHHPLLESQSECELVIDHNVYQQVVCKDLHRLQPLSSGQTGVRTESTAVLRLVKETTDDYSDGYGSQSEEHEEEEEEEEEEESSKEKYDRGSRRRTSLLFDYARTAKTVHGELRTSRDLLKTMCRLGLNTDEMQQRFSETFTAFIRSARLLDYASLSQLFVRANSICKTGK